MKERPILFSGAMVRALLSDTKTQTRRTVKASRGRPIEFLGGGPAGGPDWNNPECWGYEWHDAAEFVTLKAGSENHAYPCPYGRPGDRLWVRESLKATLMEGVDCSGTPKIVDYHYAADGAKVPRCPDLADEFTDGMAFCHLVRPGGIPSIHMPRGPAASCWS
jgi:hypothetical protein